MSTNHLYIKGNNGLLVIGFPVYLANEIAELANMKNYNAYTDFTHDVKFGKFNNLCVYKKDSSIEIPHLGLSTHNMQYLTQADIGLN